MAKRMRGRTEDRREGHGIFGGDVPAKVMWPRFLVIFSVTCLSLIGLVMVYSASSIEAIGEGGNPFSAALRQIVVTFIGAVLCALLARKLPYQIWLGRLTWVFWGVSIFLLLLTALIGVVGLGAQRWLSLGGFNLQPSEFAKIAFLLMSATILFQHFDKGLGWGVTIGRMLLLVITPLGFLFVTQSDLGTTLICIVGILSILWIAEIPLPVFIAIIIACIVFAIAASMVGYRSDRWSYLFDPWSDYYGSGYQLIHSFYAFAQGGLFGRGLGNSAEKYQYLPEAETDFIFAIIGEELGLIGALIVIVLFLLLLVGGLRMAQAAPDGFGTMICASFTIILVFQAFLNIGCVIGLIPTTGKPLPFISSGGSSLLASFIMVGIMLSVSYGSYDEARYRRRREDLRYVTARNSGRERRSSQGRSAATVVLAGENRRAGWRVNETRALRGEESSSRRRRRK